MKGRAKVRISFELLASFLRMPESWSLVSVDLEFPDIVSLTVEGWDIQEGDTINSSFKQRMMEDSDGKWYQGVWNLIHGK